MVWGKVNIVKNCFFIGFVLLFFLTACQKENIIVGDKNIDEIRTILKADLDTYLNTLDKSKLNNSTIMIVDSETGFSYSDDFGFARVNSYQQDADGVMRNWMGETLKISPTASFAKSLYGDTDLSTQQLTSGQPCSIPPKYTPYRHIETRQANRIFVQSQYVGADSGKELDQPCETAYYGVLGVRGKAPYLTAEAGFYSSGAHWNGTTRQADYFGVFFAIDEGKRTDDTPYNSVYMDFSSGVSYSYNNPVLGFSGIVPKVLYRMPGYIRTTTLSIMNRPDISNTSVCATVLAYIVFTFEGPAPYLPTTGSANWYYVIAVKTVRQKYKYDASCNQTSPTGYSFYRFASLMSVDGASMRSSVAETSFTPNLCCASPDMYMNPTNSVPATTGYQPHENESCSTKQPATVSTIPPTSNQAVLSYVQNFSDYRIYMACWTRYYKTEYYDITVSKIQ